MPRSLLLHFGVALAFGLAAANAAHAGEAPHPNVVNCIPIRTAAQLQAMRNNLAGAYCLMNDIDAGSIANFVPIGDYATQFTGSLYGNGHIIRNLTINDNTDTEVGLFGAALRGPIQDFGLVDVSITATTHVIGVNLVVGALAGVAGATVSNVYSTGVVRAGAATVIGGLLGVGSQVSDSWSSATVSGGKAGGYAGGLVGEGFKIERWYATGDVSVGASRTAGGLAGLSESAAGAIIESYATGAVTGGENSVLGGLVGQVASAPVINSFSTGPVHGGDAAVVGSLVGNADDKVTTPTFSSVYATGHVSGGPGATLGGLIGTVSHTAAITDAYWDKIATGQTASAGTGAVGRTTAQLRAALPAGFDNNTWGITKTLSYPFLNAADEFTAPLATLVLGAKGFTFLPIGQLDTGQYLHTPHHADAASLAAVYTMIARAVGITDGVALLKNVKIDKYYWHDATQAATFTGPITAHATLGPLANIAPAARLNGINVVGQMNAHRLVILRGTYSTGDRSAPGTHWMLGTMYTKFGNIVGSIIANDPWTGMQVEIDPFMKKVSVPANFPLTNFTVNGYQAVTVN
ncbi:MAG: hypothetical protein ACRECC_09820 [Pseudolabrys sp.]